MHSSYKEAAKIWPGLGMATMQKPWNLQRPVLNYRLKSVRLLQLWVLTHQNGFSHLLEESLTIVLVLESILQTLQMLVFTKLITQRQRSYVLKQMICLSVSTYNNFQKLGHMLFGEKLNYPKMLKVINTIFGKISWNLGTILLTKLLSKRANDRNLVSVLLWYIQVEQQECQKDVC